MMNNTKPLRAAAFLLAAALLLFALGCAKKSAEKAPDTQQSAQSAELGEETLVPGMIPADTAQLNQLLTYVVQQDILDMQAELDEDAELVRFAFRYLKINDPNSVAEREENGEECYVLTLGQVNAALTKLLGKTVSPDREDYSILSDGYEFHCVFRDGSFWHMPPYPEEKYSYPLRFALVGDEVKDPDAIHFRLYTINPASWGDGEAERHVGVMPYMSFVEAESGGDWITNIGEGEAKVLYLPSGAQLVSLTAEVLH